MSIVSAFNELEHASVCNLVIILISSICLWKLKSRGDLTDLNRYNWKKFDVKGESYVKSKKVEKTQWKIKNRSHLRMLTIREDTQQNDQLSFTKFASKISKSADVKTTHETQASTAPINSKNEGFNYSNLYNCLSESGQTEKRIFINEKYSKMVMSIISK